MRNSIVRTLATGAAAALLASGVAVTSTSTASATPSPTPSPNMTGKHCKEMKAKTKTITHNGKTYKVWIEGHKVCVVK
ncbi:hypothetical protein SBI_04124 [Streptomyces bingchenggensis BCW-1]|uniref:Lipoprotein n=1 Tax=Streptomyces bingchenggensis (strain BCW-1) TaxID=749414 RepID=D7BRQ8_STRBB|nr:MULTISPECIES: hypothetical protein [Streptomyces]ADI07245.1 hypothetical protein SBI_04124 [Streptomyces bingchenggensis BCW-1]